MAQKRLHVYGDEAKFRDALRRRLKSGQDLLDHLESARSQIKPVPPEASRLALALYMNPPWIDDVQQSFGRWVRENHRMLTRYLGDGIETLGKTKFKGRDTWKTPEEHLEYFEDRINYERDELQRVLDRVPPPGPAKVREPQDRFEELRRSGMIEESVLNSYVRRMSRTRTKAQISDAIGAAKELMEATMRGALDLLDVSYPDDDFGRLGRILRQEMTKRDPETPTKKAADALKQLAGGLTSTELALATLRNDVGTGHGRTNYPKGLRARHAQLAIDVADTNARYVVATLADLKII